MKFLVIISMVLVTSMALSSNSQDAEAIAGINEEIALHLCAARIAQAHFELESVNASETRDIYGLHRLETREAWDFRNKFGHCRRDHNEKVSEFTEVLNEDYGTAYTQPYYPNAENCSDVQITCYGIEYGWPEEQ